MDQAGVQGCVCGWQDNTGRKEVGKCGLRKHRGIGEVKIKAEEVLREMEEGGEEEKERMKGRSGRRLVGDSY